MSLLTATGGQSAVRAQAARRHRRTPVITFVNKWDRPGREPLELLDEIEQRIGLRPTPLTWPVGIAGQFHGVVEASDGRMVTFTRTPGGATAAAEEYLPASVAALRYGGDWRRSVEELDLLAATGAGHDQAAFEAARSTPVLFGAAVGPMQFEVATARARRRSVTGPVS